jgi:hypothetical protein
MNKKMSPDERRWRSEDDANALKRYAEIASDKRRMSDAQKVIQKDMAKCQRALKTK